MKVTVVTISYTGFFGHTEVIGVYTDENKLNEKLAVVKEKAASDHAYIDIKEVEINE